MSYRSACTTNNQAEYLGLLHGVRAAAERNFTPLPIVGDSVMIIAQLRDHRPPINARLRSLYRQVTRVSDTLLLRSWNHHYRQHNKMADLAANQAMNLDTWAQYTFPTTRDCGSELWKWLQNDVQHWFDSQQRTLGDAALCGEHGACTRKKDM